MSAHLYFVHALSPLHAGTGQDSGVVDLPIAREKATGIPYLPGSSIKGVLRDKAGDSDLTNVLFGPKTDNASEFAGSLQIADARLLLLPVRSLRGTFAWVTSPYILSRFIRDAKDTTHKNAPTPPNVAEGSCDIVPTSALKVNIKQNTSKVVLEELDLDLKSDKAQEWSTWLKKHLFPQDDLIWPDMLEERLCIVSDNTFRFLLTTSIEIIARNRLDPQTKTVVSRQLWYEEALPTESILYGLAVLSPTSKVKANSDYEQAKLLGRLNELAKNAMQFGGKATIGRGLCRLHLLGE